MSYILDLQDQLRDTGAIIARYESRIAIAPSEMLAIELHGFQKRLKKLEEEYKQVTADAGIEVCRYRLFSESGESNMAAISVFNTCSTFQSVFSAVHQSIKSGPDGRQRSRLADSQKESEFQFGYTFEGSVGIVLTFYNEQILIESALDQSMNTIFELASVTKQTKSKIISQVRILGSQVIKALHKWTRTHVECRLGLDLRWMKGDVEKGKILLQTPQMLMLTKILEEASEKIEEDCIFTGQMIGVETESKKRFHFRTDDGDDIIGSYSEEAISNTNPVQAPARYQIMVVKTYTQIITTDEEKAVRYHLTRLRKTE